MRFLLLGAPGSGKGTQGARLAQALGVPHVATGDIVRDHIAQKTPFGRQVEAAIAQGNFAPDEDILYWVSQRLKAADALRGYVLDGFPRDLAQAKAFDAQSTMSRAFDAVLEFVVREAVLMERLAGRLICPYCDRTYHVAFCPPQKPGRCDFDDSALIRRPDDAPDAVHHRFDVYETMTLPLRAYYAAQNVLQSVNAEGNPDEVARRLARTVAEWTDGPKIAHIGV